MVRISISVPKEIEDLLNKEHNKSKALWSAYLKEKGLILETKTTVRESDDKQHSSQVSD